MNYNYIEIVNDILGKDGLINDEFLNSNPNDHHLDNKKTSKLWLDKLKSLLIDIGGKGGIMNTQVLNQ